MEKWVIFALGAALCWGLYGPALQHGAHTLAYPAGVDHASHKLTGEQLASGRMKSLLGVGIAYFVLAVLLPVVVMLPVVKEGLGWSPFAISMTVAGGAGAMAGLSLLMAMEFNLEGTVAAIIAGALGAGGAIFVIFALSSGGSPAAVMPTVFGVAPLINVATSFVLDRSTGKQWENPSPLFFAGIVIAAAGVWLVLSNKPVIAKKKPVAPGATASAVGH